MSNKLNDLLNEEEELLIKAKEIDNRKRKLYLEAQEKELYEQENPTPFEETTAGKIWGVVKFYFWILVFLFYLLLFEAFIYNFGFFEYFFGDIW